MTKILRFLLYFILFLIITIALLLLGIYLKKNKASKENMALLGKAAPSILVEHASYRDLNKNGMLDPYEDPSQPIETRVNDLLAQMNLEEKAGTMFITMIGMTPKGAPMERPVISSNPLDLMMSLMMPSNSNLIARKKLSSFNILSSASPKVLATYNNTIQKLAERTRLGIPITLASDPRHGVENNPGTAIFSPFFSRWPGFLGLAATRDTQLVEEFGRIAQQEYRACGIRLALHPMADLSTEPRWGRTSGTFGEDALLSAQMIRAYVKGFQGDSLTQTSVACMAKHFPGSGTNTDGHETHFPYGKEQHYTGNNFAYHLIPFSQGALAANSAQIMTSYGIIKGQTPEDVATAFNKTLVTTLLRDSLGFDGVICTDWNVIKDTKFTERLKGGASAWGVENLTPRERVKKALEAGIDQFGGEDCPEFIVELVKSGEITEDRIDQSVRRILRDKFKLGLFEQPFVDVDAADQIAGQESFNQMGEQAQAKSVVLLKNQSQLPLPSGTKIFWESFDTKDAKSSTVEFVNNPSKADVVVKRIQAPYDPKTDYIIESFMRLGRLHYNTEEKQQILDGMQEKPTIIIINLDRPAVLEEINEEAAAVLAEFGTSDHILLDLLLGNSKPQGKLPFEMPSSWPAVLQQLEDLPYDSESPLYEFGHGLTYD